MATSILLRGVGPDSSKAEEKEFLSRVAGKVGPGSYLASLFTQELVEWVYQQITDDMHCDLMAEYIGYRDEAWKSVPEDLCRERIDRAVKEATMKATAEADDRIRGMQESMAAREAELLAEIRALTSQLKTVRDLRDSAVPEADKLFKDVRELTQENERLAAEVIALKAKLYDLMVAETAQDAS